MTPSLCGAPGHAHMLGVFTIMVPILHLDSPILRVCPSAYNSSTCYSTTGFFQDGESDRMWSLLVGRSHSPGQKTCSGAFLLNWRRVFASICFEFCRLFVNIWLSVADGR